MLTTEMDHIKQLGGRLLISLLGLTLIRIVFFTYNHTFFEGLPFLHSLKLFVYSWRFDLVAVAYANGLLILFSLLPFTVRRKAWYQLFLKILFVVFNAFLFFIEIIDVGFYQFAFRRTLYSDFFMFANNQSNLLDYFLEYWWLVVLFAGLFSGLIKAVKRKIHLPTNGKWPIQTLLFILGIGLFVLAARGGTQTRPITPISAAKYTNSSVQTHLITNTTINLIFSFQQKSIQPLHYFPEKELKKYYSIQQSVKSEAPFEPKNIMLIILESLSKEYTGAFAKTPYTPFFDSLVQESFYLENTFANGLRSTEGIAAITAGLPHLMNDPFIFSAYQTNKLDALAGLLKKKNYYSAFFHGSYKGSMEFDSFAKLQGYDAFIDKSVYDNPKDFDGHWGIWDIPFFEYTADQLSTMSHPFYATLFSLTSHHPYNVEKWFEDKYPDMDKHYRTVLYADVALRRFFEKAKKSEWYENTIFIITGDHTGPRISKSYQTSLGQYQSPIILFDPQGDIKGAHKGVGQHIDIIPTVLDILHYDLPFNAFGQSMLDTTQTNYAVMQNGVYQICDDQFLLRNDGSKSLYLFDYQNDPMNKDNLLDKQPEVTTRLENQLKARLQTFNKRMIENTLSHE